MEDRPSYIYEQKFTTTASCSIIWSIWFLESTAAYELQACSVSLDLISGIVENI